MWLRQWTTRHSVLRGSALTLQNHRNLGGRYRKLQYSTRTLMFDDDGDHQIRLALLYVPVKSCLRSGGIELSPRS